MRLDQNSRRTHNLHPPGGIQYRQLQRCHEPLALNGIGGSVRSRLETGNYTEESEVKTGRRRETGLYARLCIILFVSMDSALTSGEWLSRFVSSPPFAAFPQPLTRMCRWRWSVLYREQLAGQRQDVPLKHPFLKSSCHNACKGTA